MNTRISMQKFCLAVMLVAATGMAQAFEPGTLKWAFETGDDVVASPTVGPDGTIYIGSTDDKLYALAPNGTEKWSFQTGFDVWGSVAIGPDGTLYFGSGDGNIYALDQDGNQLWAFEMQDGTFSTPTLGADGTIYVGSLDKNIYAISPRGTLVWAFPTGGTVSSSPAVGDDGTVYCGSADDVFYAINPDGSLKWSFKAGDWIDSPTLAPDGTIYVGSVDRNLYAFTPEGGVRWTFRARGAVWGSAVLADDGTIYFGSADNNVYALNPNGSLKWRFETGFWVNATPHVGPDGTIYIGSGDQHLYAINPDGTDRWAFAVGDPLFSSPALGADGTVYVGTWSGWDHSVYAIHGDGTPSGVILASNDQARPFEVQLDGDSVFGAGRLPDFTGEPTRMSIAGTLVAGRLEVPLQTYIGRSTTGDLDVPVLVDKRTLGEAVLEIQSPTSAVLSYRVGWDGSIYEGMSDTDLVEFVYRQLFGRNADSGGLAYYVGRLESGESTRQSIMLDIYSGALGEDADAIDEVELEGSLVLTAM